MTIDSKSRSVTSGSSARIAPADDDGQLGRTIRRFRHTLHMSAAELAARTNVTPGSISQIETGVVQPSVPTLRRIAAALDLPLYRLFLDEPVPVAHLVRAAAAGPTRRRGQSSYRVLTPGGGELEVVHIVLRPQQATADAAVSHPGEECLVVLDGEVDVSLADETHRLSEGDAVTFRGEVPHRVVNNGPDPAHAISIVGSRGLPI